MSRRNKAKPNNTQVATTDAFSNQLFRLGYGSQSPLEATEYPLTRMTDNYARLNALYRDNWLVQNVVGIVPDDMTRKWVTVNGSVSPEQLARLEKAQRVAGVKDKINTGLKWGRLYGGAAGLIMIRGQEGMMDKPLDPDLIYPGSFAGVYLIDRWCGVTPGVELVQDMADPEFGLPDYYDINSPDNRLVMRVHHSRVLRFTGRELPYLERLAEMYWGASEVESIYSEVVKHDNVSANMAALTFQANLHTMEVQNLDQLFSLSPAEQQRRFWKTLQAQSVVRSNFGTQLVNKGDTITQHQYTFAGLADVYNSICMDVAGASHIPLTKLFGRSPSGLNATGESDLQNYYDYIDSLREQKLRPLLDKLLPVMAMSTWGAIPDDLDISFPPMWTPDAKEEAEIAKAKTESIINAFQAGLLDLATAQKELKRLSAVTGMFDSLTDEQIAANAGKTFQDVTALRDPMAGLTGIYAQDELTVAEDYSPNQPRGKDGRWVYAGGEENKSADPLKTDTPPLEEVWQTRFSEGERLAAEYPGYTYENAISAALRENPSLIDGIMEDFEEWGPKTEFIRGQFHKAGFYGDEPEYVTAVRFGEIPAAGRSKNWATGDLEQGVSVVRIARTQGDLTKTSIYDVTQGGQGIKKYEVRGWFLGRTGADGEPLLVNPEIIKELK